MQDIEHLQRWIGRTEEVSERVAPEPLVGLSATLDRDDPLPVDGDPVPPGGHWLYFLARVRQSELGFDGHPHRGAFLPPVELPRRMWAGGRIEFRAPLRVGEKAKRISTIADVKRKEGRTGELMFVVVRHEISGANGLSIVEEQDIVYRGMEEAAVAPSRPPPGAAVWRRTITPGPALLFRYSALIFNAHRIHYDHPFTTEEEGYPGLIVHGPLIATLLMDLCRRQAPGATLCRFDYRSVAPLFDTAPFAVEGEPDGDCRSAKVWALDPDNGLAMTAEAGFGD